jgi:hypothetical protein
LEAWLALHISLTFSKLLAADPAKHLAAHHANFLAAFFFYKCILQGAIDFAEGVAECGVAELEQMVERMPHVLFMLIYPSS